MTNCELVFLQIEIKAYYLDDQMCDICHGANCNNRHAQAFCANVICLKVVVYKVKYSKIETKSLKIISLFP